ncbi:MAG: hypothetical protein JXB10_00900 [Pirellulales bacterium]|nr:hypothetical protein [Pirellulales bacterium]
MNTWEVEAYQQDKSIDEEALTEEEYNRIFENDRKKLERIFKKYCEQGTKAKRLRDPGYSCGDPTDYDPENEIIVSVTEKANKVIIETKQIRHWCWKMKYEMINIKGEWRIKDNRKYSSEINKRWEPLRL